VSKKVIMQIEYDGPSEITPNDVQSAINYFMPGLYNGVKVSLPTPVAADKCACGNPKSLGSLCCTECIQDKKDALAAKP
jgi:hypothetical protein